MASIDQFLQIVGRQGASDLHIGEGQPPKIRTHGDIMPIGDEPILREEAAQMLSGVCGPQNWEIFQQRGDLDFAYQLDLVSRVLANYFNQYDGYAVAYPLSPHQRCT